MTRYVVDLVEGDALIIEDEHLTLDLYLGWALFSGPEGIALAIPPERVRSIQRIDQAPDTEADEP